MKKLYKPQYLEAANRTLTSEVEQLQEACKLSECQRLKTLCQSYGRCLFIGIMMLVFQQLGGVNTAMYYGPLIMQNTGVSIEGLTDDESALVLSIPLGAANFLGTIICILYIEKMGRRGVLLRAIPMQALCWVIAAIGMSFTAEGHSESTQKTGGIIVIISIIVYLFFYAIGMGAIPWTVNSEIFPVHLIGTAISIGAASNWIANFAVAETFKIICGISHGATVGMYFMLGVFCVFNFLFVWYFLTETAGKTIDQILTDILGPGYQDREKALAKKQDQLSGKDDDDYLAVRSESTNSGTPVN